MRNYGRFTTSIYQDGDFRALSVDQQGVYFMLGLQPQVTAAGTLSLTLRRWAGMAADLTRDDLEDILFALQEHRHIVIDDDTEELIIRKFIKWDGGWSNSKRLPVVIEAVKAVASDRIRQVAVGELRKIAASDAVSEDGKRARDALSNALSAFDRVVVTEGEYIPKPLTAIQGGEPFAADASAGPLSPFCSKHPNGTEGPCRDCATARVAYAFAAQQKTEQEIAAKRAAAEARSACDLCDEKGIRINPATKLPAGRCNHQPLEAVSA